MISVSVIIVNYRSSDLLTEAIYSLYKYITVSFEVIIVDNTPGGDTFNEDVYASENITLIQNKTNAGFAGANNQACRVAKGTYLFILNPDTYLCDANITHLINALDESNAGIVAPKIVYKQHQLQPSCMRFPTLTKIAVEAIGLGRLNSSGYNKGWYQADMGYPEMVLGAAFIMRKADFEELNGFDEQFFWYEDADLCFRLTHELNKRIVYMPVMTVYHYVSYSASKNLKISITNQLLSRIKFIKKHNHHVEYLLAVLLTYIHVLVRVILFATYTLFSKSLINKRTAYIFALSRLNNYIIRKDNRIITEG